LVGEEDGAQSDAQNGAEEEALAAHSAAAEQVSQRHFIGESFAIQHLRAGRNHEQCAAPGERAQQRLEELLHQETGVGVGGGIPVFGQGKFVEAG